jgi:hypothetical protein
MASGVLSEGELVHPRMTRWVDGLRRRLWRMNPRVVLIAAAFVAGAAVLLMYDPLRQIETGDEAGYDYIAQCILRGQIPYRDVVDSKAPLGMYLSALAMATGRVFGVQDVIAVRLLYAAFSGILCAIIYLVAESYFESRLAGAIAFLVPLLSGQFVLMMAGGTRPKIPLIIFGLLTLLLIARDKPFLAGLCSMLACLCWQPGLAFTGIGFLMFSQYLTSWRDRRAIRVLLGAAIPLAFVLSYFWFAGALRDLWLWTIHYNYSVYLPEGNESAATSAALTWKLVRESFAANGIWLKLSMAGALLYLIERIWIRVRERKLTTITNVWRDALLMPPLVHLAFCIVNWPGPDNLIPFLPFIGLFAGYCVVTLARIIAAIPVVRLNAFATRAIGWAPAVPLILLVLSVVHNARGYQIGPGRTLGDQQAAFKPVSDILGPDDKIYVHGTAQLLVFMNRANLNPYIFLPYGKDEYIASRRPGGFKAFIDEMDAEAPKVIALSRLRTIWHGDDLLNWVEKRYVRLPITDFAHNGVYIRKEEYRR